MKKFTYYSQILILSLVAGLEIMVCLFIPDWNFDGGLAGGAIAGAIAIAGLLIVTISFVALICFSLALGVIMKKRKIIWLYWMLVIVFLPAWGLLQYNHQQGRKSVPDQVKVEAAGIEERLEDNALEVVLPQRTFQPDSSNRLPMCFFYCKQEWSETVVSEHLDGIYDKFPATS